MVGVCEIINEFFDSTLVINFIKKKIKLYIY